MRELECWRTQLISWRLNSTLNLVLFSDESLDEEDEGAGVLEDTADQLEAERQALTLLKKLQDLKVPTFNFWLSGFINNSQCCGSGSRIWCLFDPWIRDLE